MRSGTARRSRRQLLPTMGGIASKLAPTGDGGVASELAPTGAIAPAEGTASRAAPRHLWLAVHLPALSLECLIVERKIKKTTQIIESKEKSSNQSGGAPPGEWPVVVIAGEGAKTEVVAVDAAAAALGIRPGHGLNAAYALAPRLDVLARQPRLEQQALERLARLATQYTPWVSLEAPDALLLEVRGSLRLLGGTRSLLARWRRELAREGYTAGLALTPTPVSALWCARAATPGAPVRALNGWGPLAAALAPLPLATTRWPEAVLERLAEAGVRQMGELLRLPREGLARRYGAQWVEELEQATGQRPAPRARSVLPERFVEGLDLETELTGVPALWPGVEALLESLERFLRTRDAGVHGVTLHLRHRPPLGPTTIPLGLAAPGASARQLGSLLRERLDRLPLAAPVSGLRLRSGVLVPLCPDSAALPGTATDVPIGAAEVLLDRLRARLGETAVHGVCLVPEHRPEAAWRPARPQLQPVARSGNAPRAMPVPGQSSAAMPSGVPERPLWLLPVPQRLRVRQGQPWHEGVLTAESGPERIETGWWDGAEVQRDYYTVRRADGVRLWIYRERGEMAPGSWWLHGIFG